MAATVENVRSAVQGQSAEEERPITTGRGGMWAWDWGQRGGSGSFYQDCEQDGQDAVI